VKVYSSLIFERIELVIYSTIKGTTNILVYYNKIKNN